VRRVSDQQPTIVILTWGLLIEDFLDRDGLSLEGFATEFTGSWMFGYAAALRQVGVRCVIVCVSGRVKERMSYEHRPSGATVVALRAPRAYRLLRRRMVNAYGRTAGQTFGSLRGARLAVAPLLAVVKEVAPYVSTPAAALAREVRRQDGSAILCQEYEFPRFDVCVALGRLLRVPTFATFQGGDYQRWRLERWLRPHAVRRSAGLIVGARAEASRVKAAYGVADGRMALIPNPVDTTAWRPGDRESARRALGIPAGAAVVAWHGRLAIWKKGLDILLEAWERLCRRRADELRLLLIGAGRDSGELAARLERSSLPGVVWVDELLTSPAEIAGHLAAADVYAFPSRHEGFPVALVEAIACGLPVVASDATGVEDILGDPRARAGVVVAREDPAALVDALERLLDDPERRRTLGLRARQRAQDHFSLDAVGDGLARFLLPQAA
jgi:glycosyltransferase involved in cell wall biosynthesis